MIGIPFITTVSYDPNAVSVYCDGCGRKVTEDYIEQEDVFILCKDCIKISNDNLVEMENTE